VLLKTKIKTINDVITENFKKIRLKKKFFFLKIKNIEIRIINEQIILFKEVKKFKKIEMNEITIIP
tara:strand:+ start:4459 stop:4656 length:198 start_codon:yes stop_codon:yes gene_type:complete